MIKIGKRVSKSRSLNSWEESDFSEVSKPTDKTKIIILGGNSTTSSRESNGIAKLVQTAMNAYNSDNEFRYDSEDIADLYSAYYDFDLFINDNFMNALSKILYSTNQIKDFAEYSEGESNNFLTENEMQYSEGENSFVPKSLDSKEFLKSFFAREYSCKELKKTLINSYAQEDLSNLGKDLYSFFVKNNLSPEQMSTITKEYNDALNSFNNFLDDVNEITEELFLPILIKNDEKSDIDEAINNNNLIFVTHCFGNLISNLMEQHLVNIMQALKYSESDIDKFCKSITMVNIASPIINPESRFNNFYLGSEDDRLFLNGFDDSNEFERFHNKEYTQNGNNPLPNVTTKRRDDNFSSSMHNFETYVNGMKADKYLSQCLSRILVSTISDLHRKSNNSKKSPILKHTQSPRSFEQFIQKKYSSAGIYPISEEEHEFNKKRDSLLNSCQTLIKEILTKADFTNLQNSELQKFRDAITSKAHFELPEIEPFETSYIGGYFKYLQENNLIQSELLQKENESNESYIKKLSNYQSLFEREIEHFAQKDIEISQSIEDTLIYFYNNADFETFDLAFSQKENLKNMCFLSKHQAHIPFQKILDYLSSEKNIFTKPENKMCLLEIPDAISSFQDLDAFNDYLHYNSKNIPNGILKSYKNTIKRRDFLNIVALREIERELSSPDHKD